jgi:hypothetical protein
MPDMKKVIRPAILFIISMLFATLLNSCSTMRQTSHNDELPILTQDELIRPYTKLGRIQVTRETFGTDYLLSPDIKAWGLAAVRQEAEKMGADAIMLPEVTGRTTSYGFFPSTEYHATGIAIKFK